MSEEWRHVVGYEGLYSVSNCGRLRSESRFFHRNNGVSFTLKGRVLVQTLDKRGYPKVELWKNGRQHTKKIHIAVAEAFIGPRPVDLEVCHADGKPGNCWATNLRYDTRKNNAADMVAHRTSPRGERCGTAKLTEKQVREILASSDTSTLIAPRYGVSARHVRSIRQGNEWSAYLKESENRCG